MCISRTGAPGIRCTGCLDGPVPDGLSIQETYYPSLTCFGCGHANERGLRLRSYEIDGVVQATFTPWPEHDNGGGYLNGGVISTGLDCPGAPAGPPRGPRQGREACPPARVRFVHPGLGGPVPG